jgi:hypothetical protein
MKDWYRLLPDSKLEVSEEELHEFFSTMYERQCIWKRRFIERKERPWTKNVILRDNKFTNVYRELDRSSQWEIKNIILDDTLSLTNLIWKILAYRTFNNLQTFEVGIKLGYKNGIVDFEDYDEEEFYNFIRSVRNDYGLNPFTSSYFIHPGIGHDREYNYSHKTIPELHNIVPKLISIAKTAKRPEEIIEILNSVTYVSDFISHEYYQDFTYIERYTDKQFMPFNQNDFTNVGDGADLGIRLIFPDTRPKNRKSRIYDLLDIAELYLQKIGECYNEPMPYVRWNKKKSEYEIVDKCNLTLHQVEMWLCEYGKYWKMKHAVGKQRSKYIVEQGNTAMIK